MDRTEKLIASIIIIVQAILFFVGKVFNWNVLITYSPTIIVVILLLIMLLWPTFKMFLQSLKALDIALKHKQHKIFKNQIQKLKDYA